tara:strand:- start:416 stop:1642 length:1227 start_codon:yes stop_codon:yes gene_type:complete
MANLEGKLSQYGTIVMYTSANRYLEALNSDMHKSLGISLTPIKGYLSKYEVVDELRAVLGDEWRLTQVPKTTVPDGSFDIIKPLLDVNKSIADIIATNSADYDTLAAYIDDLADNNKGAFQPPLKKSFTVNGLEVYPIPQSSEKDPRRGARLITFSKFTVSVKDWLINNAILYGFTLYQDYGLYYIGFNQIKSLANTNSEVARLINKFQSTPIPATQIDITVEIVQKAEDPGKFTGTESKATKNNPLGKTISANGPNANRLRSTIASLGYREKGIEIDNGGDITPELSTAASALFRKIKQIYPQYTVTVSGGNDFFHHGLGYTSRHTLGNGLDFVISPSSNPSDLNNIVSILNGFSKGLNPYFRYIDEYRHQTSAGTGNHFHISWGVGSEGSATLANAVANSPVTYTI